MCLMPFVYKCLIWHFIHQSLYISIQLIISNGWKCRWYWILILGCFKEIVHSKIIIVIYYFKSLLTDFLSCSYAGILCHMLIFVFFIFKLTFSHLDTRCEIQEISVGKLDLGFILLLLAFFLDWCYTEKIYIYNVSMLVWINVRVNNRRIFIFLYNFYWPLFFFKGRSEVLNTYIFVYIYVHC